MEMRYLRQGCTRRDGIRNTVIRSNMKIKSEENRE